MLKYEKAAQADADRITKLVQETICAVYPKYYPKEVVDFFLSLHCEEKISCDIKLGRVSMLLENDVLVGTGSCEENHITRIYVSPACQRRGYGSYIMQRLENAIAENYSKSVLDSSLPASKLYESRGYQTTEHRQWNVENNVVLVYEIMEKNLNLSSGKINYDGKIFIPKMNTENGEVDGETVFRYHQNGEILWAEYDGGEIIRGHIIGAVSQQGLLDFYYQHINKKGQVKIGKCHSIPKLMEDGKLEMHEEWQCLNGNQSSGSSVLIEK